MEKNKFSLSALVNAYYRGYHAKHDRLKIFDDFLAAQFLTEEERVSFDRQFVTALQGGAPALAGSFPDQAAALAWIMQRWTSIPLVTSRVRYAEDSLEEAVRQGVKQYVILGAGMDTFAFRRKELVERLQVFEVDHPSTQAFKRRRLAELDAFVPERAAKRVYAGMKWLRQTSGTMITGFDPSTLAADLDRVGLRLHEQLSPSEIQKRYFTGRPDSYYAYEHAHFAYAVVE